MVADSLLEDIDHLYQAAQKPELYGEFFRRLADRIGCDTVNFFGQDQQTGTVNIAFSHGVSLEKQVHYAKQYALDDPLVKKSRSIHTEVASSHKEVISEKEYKGLQIYQEFYKDAGMYHWLGVDIVRDEKERLNINFTRHESDRDFNDCERAYLQALIPHLKNAQLINTHFRAAQHNHASLFAYFSNMPQPMFAVDMNLRLLHLNDAASVLAAGKATSIKNQYLNLTTHNAQKQLLGILNTFSQDKPGFPKNHAISYGEFEIKVMLLHADQNGELDVSKKIAILVFESSETQDAKITRLSQHYQLTNKEVQIMRLLVDGLTVKLISEMMSVSVGAVRFHLKNIFMKTNTHSQKELVLLFIKK